ncbi:ribonuclease BN [Streptomyces sp. RB6PN25]|uniref:Ribonuclease BN n=1 Tax=Streptomyces humicola TaxID=2953240 RepID=A0ABT1Q1A2_9ACTN|nr:ribonuclease BN [Streptomyces humicola]MCQ4083676.1 ribonuclease BN [Streptomyces humicola]
MPRRISLAGRLKGARRRLALRSLWVRGKDLELLHRAMGFAALALVTMTPLLIVVAAANPFTTRGFSMWVVDGMGLSGRPAQTVQRLFSAPLRVLSTTSAFGLLALAVFGLTFAASVQTGYEKIWELSGGPWHKVWRQAVWLVALTGYLYALVQSGLVLRHGAWEEAIRVALTVLFGVLFFWWGQRVLLGSRVPWRALWPGAVATVMGLGGLRGFSFLVFAPLIVTNAVTYGVLGTVLVVQSWLIGVGFVVFGGALIGRHFHERLGERGELPT